MPSRAKATPPPQSFVAVARVIRPWGLHGELRIAILSESSERFGKYRELYLLGEPRKVQRRRTQGRFSVVKLAGIDSPQDAEALRDATLEVPESWLEPLPENTYYHFQIVGLKAVTADGEELGEIAEIITTGANDVYVSRGPRGEVLIPAIADVVQRVDLEQGVVVVEPMEGLFAGG